MSVAAPHGVAVLLELVTIDQAARREPPHVVRLAALHSPQTPHMHSPRQGRAHARQVCATRGEFAMNPACMAELSELLRLGASSPLSHATGGPLFAQPPPAGTPPRSGVAAAPLPRTLPEACTCEGGACNRANVGVFGSSAAQQQAPPPRTPSPDSGSSDRSMESAEQSALSADWVPAAVDTAPSEGATAAAAAAAVGAQCDSCQARGSVHAAAEAAAARMLVAAGLDSQLPALHAAGASALLTGSLPGRRCEPARCCSARARWYLCDWWPMQWPAAPVTDGSPVPLRSARLRRGVTGGHQRLRRLAVARAAPVASGAHGARLRSGCGGGHGTHLALLCGEPGHRARFVCGVNLRAPPFAVLRCRSALHPSQPTASWPLPGACSSCLLRVTAATAAWVSVAWPPTPACLGGTTTS